MIETEVVHCGECSEIMSTWPDDCIDLTVTSPPYDNLRDYHGYVFDFEAIAQQLYRVTKPGGVVVWVVADQTINGSETGTSFRQALRFMEMGFNLHDTMIYEAPGTGAKGSNLAYWQTFEYMFIFSVGTPSTVNRIADKANIKAKQSQYKSIGGRSVKKYGKKSTQRVTIASHGIRTNIWRIAAGNNGDDKTPHPAPFPEALARDHIISWSNPGDVVLDPMCGSGTTLKMAKELDRKWIGIDTSEEYCELSRRRVEVARIPLPEFWGLTTDSG